MKRKEYFDYFGVIIFVFTSCAVFWHIGLSPAISFTFYLLLSFVRFYKAKRKINSSFFFVIFTYFVVFYNFLTYGTVYKDNSTFGYLITLLGSYFFISTYTFRDFRYKYINIIYWINLVALPLYLLYQLGMLPASYKWFGDTSFVMFGPFVYGWEGSFNRFAGIWHEPGACMMFQCMALWLNIDKLCLWKFDKGDVKKIIVIVIALLATKSTGGYINFIILFATVLINVKIKRKYRIVVYPLVALVTCFSTYLLYNSDVIQEKIFVDESESVSKKVRTENTLALLQMSSERPLLGYGIGSKEFFERSIVLNNISSSSGILKFMACLGCVWLLVFLILVFKNMKRLYPPMQCVFFLVAFIALMNNEDYMEFPISHLFLFKFVSTQLKINNINE